ncbi:MAG TPA: ABC transporter permease [Gaiellaceae bacterium]|jgi:ABC-type transport system involved in multi-copper enzyme maturation permease subunit
MTAFALPAPRLVGADILKLRRNRSLAVITAVLTVGAVAITVAIMEVLHVANPAKHGPAGGVANLGHIAFLISVLGTAAAAIVGSRAGAGDKDAGVYRDLVVTGRSRIALYLSRIPAGAAFLLPFVASAYALAAISAVVFSGSKPVPDMRLLVLTGLWTLLEVAFFYLLSVAIAALLGSRSYAIGVVLAFRLAITPLVASISALGIVRELMPGVAMQALTPSALGDAARQGPAIAMSTGAVAAVLLVWAVAAVVLAGWRDVTRDA